MAAGCGGAAAGRLRHGRVRVRARAPSTRSRGSQTRRVAPCRPRRVRPPPCRGAQRRGRPHAAWCCREHRWLRVSSVCWHGTRSAQIDPEAPALPLAAVALPGVLPGVLPRRRHHARRALRTPGASGSP